MGEFTISMAMLIYLRVYQHEIAQHPMGRHLAVGSPMTGLNTGSIIGYEVGSGHHLPTGHVKIAIENDHRIFCIHREMTYFFSFRGHCRSD